MAKIKWAWCAAVSSFSRGQKSRQPESVELTSCLSALPSNCKHLLPNTDLSRRRRPQGYICSGLHLTRVLHENMCNDRYEEAVPTLEFFFFWGSSYSQLTVPPVAAVRTAQQSTWSRKGGTECRNARDEQGHGKEVMLFIKHQFCSRFHMNHRPSKWLHFLFH